MRLRILVIGVITLYSKERFRYTTQQKFKFVFLESAKNEKEKVTMLVSFIIPAHNSAATIERTVNSIEAIHLDAEIIIVENGSVDNTKDVINKLSEHYRNLVILSSEKGVSKARNKGIEAATGEWILFVDSDDECMSGIEKMKEHLNRGDVDLIIGSYKKDDDIISHDYNVLNSIIENTDGIKSWLISRPTLRMQAWAKIYRSLFLKENGLRFDETLSYSEDSEFVIRVLMKAQKIMITDNLFYQYHSGTVSAMRGFREGRIEKYIRALEAAEKDVNDESARVQKSFKKYVIAHINIIGVHDIFGSEIKNSWRNRCKKMRELMKEGVIERALKNKYSLLSLQSLPVIMSKNHLIVLGGVIYYCRSLQNKKRYLKARNGDE